MFSLTIRIFNQKASEYHLNSGLTSIGRSSENDIALEDDGISRHHAELDFDPGTETLILRDLQSTNGTFVNGKRIFTPTRLESNDLVRMGNCLISVNSDKTTQPLETGGNNFLNPELSQELYVKSIENFGFLLNTLSQHLINISDQAKIVSIISTFTKNLIAGTDCHIFLRDELDDLPQKGIPASIAKTIIEEKTPILLSNIQADKSLTESLTDSNITSLILVPIIINSSLPGIIFAYQEGKVEKPFDHNDLQIVMAISNQVSLTLQRLEYEKELIFQANHDPLTKLPNRTRLLETLEHALARSRREEDFHFALIFFDVDNFKLINDGLGHNVGDKILISIGERLIQNFREVDTFARLGGDEFVILYEDLRRVDDTSKVAERLIKCFSQPFLIENHEIFVTVSVGVTTNAMNYNTAEEALRDADIAMYRAKEKAGSNFILYDGDMHRELIEKMELQTGVRKAVYKEELDLYYQPIVSLQTGQIAGFEALVRWNSPEKGFLEPGEFLFHLGDTGLLNDIDLWVLGRAMDDFSHLVTEYRSENRIFISVNVSEKSFFHNEVRHLIDLVVTKTNFDCKNLVFEITEKSNIKVEESVIKVINNLRSKGIRLSLDDFGTGFSTLGYLHRFPVDYLKIDNSLIQTVEKGDENSRIVETMVSLAEKINIKVIAEGVETKNQLDFLRKIGCEYAQGYYFSRPVDIIRVQDLLRTGHVWPVKD